MCTVNLTGYTFRGSNSIVLPHSYMGINFKGKNLLPLESKIEGFFRGICFTYTHLC